MFIAQNHVVKFVLNNTILMGGNQGIILTRIDLYELLQSISGKLIIERIHSEIMET